jgi:phage tail sheath protein FI
MFGDWLWWNDQVNATLRLVSPQGFAAGRLANLSPEQSSLNKPLYGVVGSQKSGTPGTRQSASYSAAELGALLQAGIDVIANPQPAGAFWGVRGGHNASSNAAINGDNYTRLTNYIAATLAAGMGQYVGQVVNSSLFQRIRATQLSFLQGMLSQGLLGSSDGNLPFSVICDTSNNPASRTGLGYVQSDAQVQYQAINEKFIVNMEGGQTVIVQMQTLPNTAGALAA